MNIGDTMEHSEEKQQHRKMRLWVKLLILFFLSIILTILYSRYISTSGLFIKEYLVIDEDLPNSFNGIKIAHITDVHYGQTIHKKELEKVVKAVNEYQPDIIVITGDLLDRDIIYDSKDITDISKTLSKLEASLGKYIIMGNHDNVQDVYEEIVQKSGLTYLNEDYQILYNYGNEPILIAGISTGEYSNKTPQEKVADATKKIKEENINYSILIMHEPDYIDDIDYKSFDLVLAGHSHAGQVRLPLIGAIILPPHAQKYYDEHYKIDDTNLYISSGIGTSTIKFRWFNRPSINLYRLVKK